MPDLVRSPSADLNSAKTTNAMVSSNDPLRQPMLELMEPEVHVTLWKTKSV